MMVVEHVGVRMMKEYFEIKASKATPQYGFRKGLKLFGGKGYQAIKDELRSTYSEEDVLIYCHKRTLLVISESKRYDISRSKR